MLYVREKTSPSRLRRAVLLTVALAIALASVGSSVDMAQSDVAEAGAWPAAAASPIRLDVTSGPPGGTAEVRLAFNSADGVRGFILLLQFAPDGLLSAAGADFQRAPAFFPEASLGSHALNSARDAGSGRIRIVGLAPTVTTGPAEVGTLRLAVRPNAAIGATEILTLTGQLDLGDGVIMDIAPVVATLHVSTDPPAPLSPIVSITRSGNSVTLAWQHSSANAAYQVWRGVAPYFSPGDANTANVGDGATGACSNTTGQITCADSDVLGEAGVNYFYLVRAFNADQAWVDSHRVGTFNFGLQAGSLR